MARRRLLKSYFYVMYKNQRTEKGGTVTLSPFEATGGTDSFTVYSSKAWTMGAKPNWISTNVGSGKTGPTTVTVTAAQNTDAARNNSTNIGPRCFLDRRYITIAYSQTSSSVEYRNLTVSPVSMTLGSDDRDDGKPIQAFADEYVNGSYSRRVEVTSAATWSSQDTDIAICQANGNGEVVKPVYGYGDFPVSRTTTVTAGYLNSAATCEVEVEPQGFDEYRLEVTPVSVTINSDGTQALTAWLRYYVDGVHTPSGDRNVTSDSSTRYYISQTSVSNLISVDSYGVIHGNGVAAGGTATIEVTHPDARNYVDVAVTVNPTSIEYRNLTVSPASMSLDTSDLTSGKAIHAYADEYVNGALSRTVEVTSAASWSSQDTSVAICEAVSNDEVVKPVYGSGDYPTTRTTTVTATYLSSAATCNVSVAPEGRVTYVLAVTPTTATIDSNGSTSLTVTLQAYVDGVRDSSQDRTVTTSAGYSESSNLINVDSSGHVTGTGQLTGGDAVIRVTHTDVPGQYVDVTIHVNDAGIDYRDLYVSPTSMSLTTADTASGKAIKAYVKKYVNNTYVEDVEVTTSASWSSQDTSVATCNSVTNGEVVKPVYGQSYYPTTRTTTVTASYLNSAATCNVSVAPEGYVEYELVVTPATATLEYGETTGLTAIYYVVTDGVRDAGTDVTNSATYSPNNSAATVNNSGVVTGNNTGTTNVTTNIAVSYGQADPVTVTITSKPATRTKVLVVTANPSTIGPTGTSQLSAVYQEFIGSQKVYEENVDATAVTWSVTAGSQYVDSISNAGVLKADNDSSDSNVTAKVKGSYTAKDVTGDTTVTIQARSITYKDVFFVTATSTSSYSDLENVSIAAEGYEDHIFLFQDKYINGSISSVINDTDSTTAGYTLYSGQTALTSFQCTSTGLKYSDNYVAIYYRGSTYGIEVSGRNSTQEAKYYSLQGGDDGYGDSIGITVGAYVPAYDPYVEWDLDPDVFIVPAYRNDYSGDEPMSSATFSYGDIDQIIDIDVLGGNDVEVTDIRTGQTGTSTGSCKLTASENKTLSQIFLGTVRVSGHGMDNELYYDDLDVYQAAGVAPVLLIESSSDYEDEVSSAASQNVAYDLDYDYIDISSLGWSYSGGLEGNVTAVTIDTAHNYLYVSWNQNSTTSGVRAIIRVTATTVYGDTIEAHLDLRQAGYSAPTTSITWDYGVHFFGTHGERVRITFYLKYNGTTYGTAIIDEDDLDDSVAGDEFTGTTTVSVPVGSISQLEVTDDANYSYSYYDYTKSNPFVSMLYVPSITQISIDIYAQAFRGEGGGDAFPVKFTVQSLTPDQTPMGSTDTLNGTVTNVGPTNDIHNTADYNANDRILNFGTRMGCWLQISVDTSVTDTFDTLRVISEDDVEFDVEPQSVPGRYWVFLGDTVIDIDRKVLFVKFIDSSPQPVSCTFNLVYEGAEPIAFDGDAVFTLYYSNIDTSTIGTTYRSTYIQQVTLESAGPGKMYVTCNLDSNCTTADRSVELQLSASCNGNAVYASDSTTQEHSVGYIFQITGAPPSVDVINNTSQDIYFGGLQIYSRNDCSADNMFQVPISTSEMIPAAGQKTFNSVIGARSRSNDNYVWADWYLTNLPQNAEARLQVQHISIDQTGTYGEEPIGHNTTVLQGNIKLVINLP